MEEKFQQNHYLTGEEAFNLSRKLDLTVDKIKIWFQNRRARKRREELGEVRKTQQTSNQIDCVQINKDRKHRTEDGSVIDIVRNQPTVSMIYFAGPSISNPNGE